MTDEDQKPRRKVLGYKSHRKEDGVTLQEKDAIQAEAGRQAVVTSSKAPGLVIKVPKRRGRPPTRQLSDLPEGWVDDMLDLYARGASDTEVRVKALENMGDTLWYRFLDREPEFARVVRQGRRICQSWWEEIARNAVDRSMQTFNATIWIFNMKNRFGWRDVREQHTKISGKAEVRTIVELIGSVTPPPMIDVTPASSGALPINRASAKGEADLEEAPNATQDVTPGSSSDEDPQNS